MEKYLCLRDSASSGRIYTQVCTSRAFPRASRAYLRREMDLDGARLIKRREWCNAGGRGGRGRLHLIMLTILSRPRGAEHTSAKSESGTWVRQGGCLAAGEKVSARTRCTSCVQLHAVVACACCEGYSERSIYVRTVYFNPRPL